MGWWGSGLTRERARPGSGVGVGGRERLSEVGNISYAACLGDDDQLLGRLVEGVCQSFGLSPQGRALLGDAGMLRLQWGRWGWVIRGRTGSGGCHTLMWSGSSMWVSHVKHRSPAACAPSAPANQCVTIKHSHEHVLFLSPAACAPSAPAARCVTPGLSCARPWHARTPPQTASPPSTPAGGPCAWRRGQLRASEGS